MQPKNLNIGQQNNHIEGTNEYKQKVAQLRAKGEYGPSKLTITKIDMQKLIENFSGTGKIRIKNGAWDQTETIVLNEMIIGYVINNFTGQSVPTSIFKIHYGKKGVHTSAGSSQ